MSASYPAITAGSNSYREAPNFACSGADTTATLAQVAAIDERIKLKATLVTITVGGIDAGSNQVPAARRRASWCSTIRGCSTRASRARSLR